MSLCNRNFKVLFRPKASPIQYTAKHSLEKLHSPNPEFPIMLEKRKARILDPLSNCCLSRGRQASPCESKCHHISFVTDPLGASDCDPGPLQPAGRGTQMQSSGPSYFRSQSRNAALANPQSCTSSKSFDGKQSRPWRSKVDSLGGSKPPTPPRLGRIRRRRFPGVPAPSSPAESRGEAGRGTK